MTTEIASGHCVLCLNVAGERVPSHGGAHLFEGHPEKDGVWWDHWELRRKGLETFGDEFDRDALKMFGYRPRDRWGLEPRKIRPNYGRPGATLKDLEGRKDSGHLKNPDTAEKNPDKIPDIICGGCGKPVPQGATKPRRFHNDACRKRASRKGDGE